MEVFVDSYLLSGLEIDHSMFPWLVELLVTLMFLPLSVSWHFPPLFLCFAFSEILTVIYYIEILFRSLLLKNSKCLMSVSFSVFNKSVTILLNKFSMHLYLESFIIFILGFGLIINIRSFGHIHTLEFIIVLICPLSLKP